MQYTLNIIFNQDKTKVLMQLKDRSIYAGKYNFPGGKMQKQDNNDLKQCAFRELLEETGVKPEDVPDMTWIGTIILPNGCTEGHLDEQSELGFFAMTVRQEIPKQQPGETEALQWCQVENVPKLRQLNLLAGDGELELFLNKAVKSM